MRCHYKTRFPAANVPLWNEYVATDTSFSDIPAHDDSIPGHGGCTMVQIHTGITSHFQKFSLCLLSHKFQIHFVTFFVIVEHQIASRVTVLKLNKVKPSRKSYATTI